MSTTVDNRVVQMKFNNQQFESNAKETLKTLEKLKTSLNFDGVARSLENGFANIERSISVSGIAANVDEISDRFSALGIVGQTMISNLTNKVLGLASSLSNIVLNPIVEGGKRRALNIEAAKFQLEGLKVAWEDIEDDISYGVQDTAYGLDAAAKAASQLVASNVQLGDEMKSALRGISGVAAMTSSSYEDIANIFTTVAGNGRLMTEQLRMLSSRGLNAAAELAKQLGVTEAEVREMVTNGKVDFAMFSKAMNEAYGEHAKDANKTFTGALSNTRAALARIGAKFATPAYENIKNVLNELIPVVNNINKALDPFVALAEAGMKASSEFAQNTLKSIDTNKVAEIGKIIVNIVETLKSLKNVLFSIAQPIRIALREMFPESALKRVRELSDDLLSLSKNFEITESTADKLKSIFKGVFAVVRTIGDISTAAVSKLSPVIGVIADIAEKSLTAAANLGDRLTQFANRVKTSALKESFQKAANIFAESFSRLEPKLETLAKDIKAFFGDDISKAGEAIEHFLTKPLSEDTLDDIQWLSDTLETLSEAMINTADAAVRFAAPIKDAFKDMMPSLPKQIITDISDAMKKLSERLIANSETLENVKRTVKGLLAVADIAAQLIAAVVRTLFPTTESFFDFGEGVLSATGTLGNFLVKLDESLRENDTFYNAIQSFLSMLKRGFEGAKEALREFQSIFEQTTGKQLRLPTKDELLIFWEKVKDVFSFLPVLIEKAKESIASFFGLFKQDDTESSKRHIEAISETLVDLADKVKEITPGLGEFFKDLGNAFGQVDSDRMAKILNIAFFIVLLNALNRLRGVLSTLFSYGRPLHNLNGLLVGGKGLLTSMSRDVSAGSIVKIAKAVALLAASLIGLSTVKEERLTSALSAMVIIFGMLLFAMSRVNKAALGSISNWGVVKMSAAMLIFAGAVTVLARAVKLFDSISTEGVSKSFGAMISIIVTFTVYVGILSTWIQNGLLATATMVKIAAAFSLLGIAMNIIAWALKKFERIDEVGIMNGVLSLIGMMIGLTFSIGMLAVISSSCPTIVGYLFALSGSLMILAGVIAQLAVAFALFNKVTDKGLIEGLLAFTAVLAVLMASAAIISRLVYYCPSLISSMFALCGAMIILAGVVAELALSFTLFNNVSKDGLHNGIAAFSTVMFTLAASSVIFASWTKRCPSLIAYMFALCGAMIILAGVISQLAVAFTLFNNVTDDGLVSGIASFISIMMSLTFHVGLLAVISSMSPTIVGYLFALSGAMVILAEVVTQLAVAFSLFNHVTDDGLFAGLTAFLTVMISMTVVASIFGVLASQFPAIIGSMLVVNAAMALLAVVVAKLAAAFLLFNKVDVSSIVKGLTVLFSGLLLILGVAITLAQMKALLPSVLKNLLIMSVSLAVFAGILGKLAVAFMLFNKVEFSSIGKGIIALFGVLVVLGFVPAVLGQFAPAIMAFAGALIVLGIAFASIAGSIALLTPSLAILGNMSLSSIGRGLIAVAGALIVMSVAAAIVGELSLPLAKFAATLVLFAGTIILLSGAVMMIVPALEALGSLSFSQIIKGLIAMAGAILVFSVVALILRTCVGPVLKFALVISLLAIAIAAAGALLGGLMLIVGESVEKLADILVQSIPKLVQIAFDILLALVNGLADAIRNNAEEIWLALRNLFGALLELLLSGLEQLFRDFIPGVGEKIADAVKYARECVHDYWAPPAKDAGSEISGNLLEGAGINLPDINNMGQLFGENFADGANGTGALANAAGGNLGNMFASGLTGTGENAAQAGGTVGENALTGLTGDSSGAGINLGNMFANGLEGTEGGVSDAANALSGSGVEGLLSADSDYTNAGNSSGLSYINGLLNTDTKADSAGGTIAETANDGINSKSEDFRVTGHNAGQGFADGLLLDSRGSVYAAASALARTALNAMMATLEIHSPSKKFKRLGVYSAQGYAGGLVSSASLVADASETVADAALGAVAQVSDILASDIDVDPTIRPVMDLSDVANGAAVIGGMLNSQTMSVGMVSGKLAQRSLPSASKATDEASYRRTETNRIVSTIGELRSDVSRLSEVIKGIEVRLDSGELVGALAGPMDAAIGKIAVRKGRWV